MQHNCNSLLVLFKLKAVCTESSIYPTHSQLVRSRAKKGGFKAKGFKVLLNKEQIEPFCIHPSKLLKIVCVCGRYDLQPVL